MARKHKCPPAGAPDWVMTFGDLMSLLLTFFILLVSMSEIKSEDVWRAKAEVVKNSFGLAGGGGKTPGPDDPKLSMVEKLQKLQIDQEKERNHSETRDEAVEGRVLRVQESRKDLVRGVGSVVFESGSAKLSKLGEYQARFVVGEIKGFNNKIELHGHASSSEAGVESDYPDLWALSHARTRTVMNYMIKMGIKRERIRLVANADKEPLVRREIDPRVVQPNRRVSIEISDRLVNEFTTSISH